MPPTEAEKERAKKLEAFRHEQTVKRWQKGHTKKPSKVVYVADFMGDGALHEKHRRRSTAAKGAGVLRAGTLLLGGHRGGSDVGGRKGHAPAAKAEKRPKQRNPNSDAPFNHRKRFTALKRRIHAQRRAAMETQLLGHRSDDASPARLRRIAQSHRLVQRMELLFRQMDAAMHAKQYSLAGRLKLQIRRRRHELHRLLTAGRPSGQADAPGDAGSTRGSDSGGAEAGAEDESALPSLYVNHYPPSVLLGVGRHSRHESIDTRTGRYPHKLEDTVVQAFLRQATDWSLREGQEEELAVLCLRRPDGDPASSGEQRGGARQQRLFVGQYCRNVLTDFLDDLVFTTLQGLYSEQRELKQRQPMQFKARQRYVVGFQETIKHLRAGRVKLVLLAADIEVRGASPAEQEAASAAADGCASKGKSTGAGRRKFQTLEEALTVIAALCKGGPSRKDNGEPATTTATTLVTCMSRQRLSYALFAKGSRVACVGLLHAERHLYLLKALHLLATGLRVAYESGEVPGEEGR